MEKINTKSKIWVISDTHLGHGNMVKYCGRPENHSELILQNLTEEAGLIKHGDTLIHLGDVCFGDDEEWHRRFMSVLGGVKTILVRGNHDKKSTSWYLEHGWDFVCESFKGHYFGKYITFSHIPVTGIQNLNIHGHYHNNLPRLLEKKWAVEGEKERNDLDFDLDNYNPKIYQLIAIENTDYKPVLLEDILRRLQSN